MSQSIHGHEVLYFLLNSEEPLDIEHLEDRITELYGTDPRFHTCSVEGMNFKNLIEFLQRRGKITVKDGVVQAHRKEICDH